VYIVAIKFPVVIVISVFHLNLVSTQKAKGSFAKFSGSLRLLKEILLDLKI